MKTQRVSSAVRIAFICDVDQVHRVLACQERLYGLSNPQGNHGEDVKETSSLDMHIRPKYSARFAWRLLSGALLLLGCHAHTQLHEDDVQVPAGPQAQCQDNALTTVSKAG